MSASNNLLQLTPMAFVDFLGQNNISRFFFYYDNDTNQVCVSHPQLQQLADFLNGDQRDFAQHESGFFQVSPQTGILQGAFVHRTNRGQAAGGVRFWQY